RGGSRGAAEWMSSRVGLTWTGERTGRAPGASTRGRVPLARSQAPRQNAPVPREVVLLLPPSPEPPATTQPALRAAAAGALGCAPDAPVEARLRPLSFDAPPRERRRRLGVDVWMRGPIPPPTPPTSPPPLPAAPPPAPPP